MDFSFWPNVSQSWVDLLAVVGHVESTGWTNVYVADHFMGDGNAFGADVTPTMEATAVLSGLAAVTSRVGLGSIVFGITYRHPAVLANWAATADIVSGGRLILGVGAGWQINEHEQYGIELGRPGVRIDRFDEACQVLNGLLRTPVTSLDGAYYQLTDAISEPKPNQARVPLLIGGKGNRMMGVVARHADRWNMWSLGAAFAERGAALDRACETIGRDPGEIRRSTQALWFVTDDNDKADALIGRAAPRDAIGGNAQRLIEAVGSWHEAGVDEVIVPDFTLGSGQTRLDALDLVINEVAPHFA